jgi:predicted TIM-barrel fold metal-dependent hydrolase
MDADPETTVNIVVAAMDAVGVDAVVIAELGARDILRDPEPRGFRLPNGALRRTHPFSESAVSMYPDRFGYVYHVDPRDPDATNLIADIRNKPGALCTRNAPTLRPAGLREFAAGSYNDYFAASEKYGVPAFLFLSDRPDLLVPYARRFPDLSFIVDHWGYPMPAQSAELGSEYFDSVLALAHYPNVCLKWCKGARFVTKDAYPHRGLEPYFRRSLDAFGPERIMWASDTTQSSGVTTWAEEIYHIMDSAALSTREKEQIFSTTARTILRWPAS